MNRKQRREAEKLRKKNDPNQIMADQIHLFGKLPDHCLSCQKTFDKSNKEMVMSWSVVVKSDNVSLFCPDCVNKTKEVLNGRAIE